MNVTEAHARPRSTRFAGSKASGAGPGVLWREVRHQRECVDVSLVGELDLAAVPKVERRLLEHRRAGFARMVLDLRELTFIDLAGIRLVERWAAAAETEGFQLVLMAAGGAAQRMFDLVAAVRAQEGLVPLADASS